MTSAIDVPEKFAAFTDQWSPKVIARLNDDEVKLVRAGKCA